MEQNPILEQVRNPVLEQLNDPITQTALVALLENLPKYTQSLEAMDRFAAFGQAMMADKTISKYEEMLRTYDINVQTLGALLELTEKLPSLLDKINQIENMLSFVTSILNDEESKAYVAQSVKEYTDPVVEKGKQGADLWRAVQQEASQMNEPIKTMAMLKWLKDPNVQQSLKYVQATLNVLNKK